MSGGTLGIGIIGGGTIAEFHLLAYAKNPDVEIIAICDIDPERAVARAAQFGAKRSYTSVEELLADPEIDAVSICTRNDTHVSLSVQALEAGKSVLVEKPMARTVADAEALAAAEAVSPGIVQVGYVRRWSPNAQILKTFIEAGDLGEIYYAKATCIRRAGNPGGWFADKEISGGGPLIDLGVHFIDIVWWLMGAPKVASVSGFTFEKLGNRGNIETLTRWKSADYDASKNTVEDLAGALVRFENGAVLTFDTSYSVHGRDEVGVKIFGTAGGAELEPELRVFTEVHDTIVELAPQIDSLTFEMEAGFQNEIDGFVDAALGRRESLAPATHGLELTRILAAIYESAATGREVLV
ncbi:Gfo/Idh/MocA family oxidoreductase [Microbacteriaceae bacterium VKM Ac-2855]|nr:Gfo/Idh/MocA family oxidoreductase [Microbacteriaceae bacterium VKM Ac-2855]